MIRNMLQKLFVNFGNKYNYDTDYLEELAQIYPAKAWRYMLLSLYSSHRKTVSKEAYFAAKITATQQADCGPCIELAIAMAKEARLDLVQLQAIITGDQSKMSPDARLGRAYAHALLNNAPSLDALIRDITVQYGKRGLWDMSSAVAMGEFFPKLKRGIGEAKACIAPQELAKEIANEYH